MRYLPRPPSLRAASIATAVTCDYGLNDAATDKYALMRFLDGENVSLLEFEAAVSGFSVWLGGFRNLVGSLRRISSRTSGSDLDATNS